MAKDVMGIEINVGDDVVAPFGKNHAVVCVVIRIRPKTCLVLPVERLCKRNEQFYECSKIHECLTVVNSVAQKIEKLGL